MIKRGGLVFAVSLAALWLLVALSMLTVENAQAMSNGAPALKCTQCHVGADKNPASFVIEGLPSKYEPGKTYKITIKITKGPDCKGGVACGGFAVTASAGQLIVVDSENTFKTKLPTGEVIITHTKKGSTLREWTFEWIAPKKPEPVTFKVSVIAANGDGSFTGDAFATKTITLEPLIKTPVVKTTVKPVVVKVTSTITTTTTIVRTKISRSPGLAIAVAVIVFVVVVAAYLLAVRRR